jgi:hypothetical protein
MKRPDRAQPSRFALLLIVTCVAVLSTVTSSAFAMTSTGAARSPDARSAACRAGFKPAIIGGNFKCLRVAQSCSARYQKAYLKYGFNCVSGHLRKAAHVRATPPPPPVLPSPPPPPPPVPPPAQPGHYKGTTSQNETFEFDVTADGRAFRGLKTGQINEGCTPGLSIYWNYFDWPYYTVPIIADGTFALNVPYSGTVGPYPSIGRIIIEGHMSGAVGVGSLALTTYFTANGVPYDCGSGRQTWIVTRT